MPPMPRTLPMIVISPVMARSLRTGTPFSAETIRVTMVIPADGPSFGTPIIVAGTATSWFSCQSVGKSSDSGARSDELGRRRHAFFHYSLHGTQADDPARALQRLDIEVEDAPRSSPITASPRDAIKISPLPGVEAWSSTAVDSAPREGTGRVETAGHGRH